MTIYIPGNPVGKERQRHNQNNPHQRPRTPEKTRNYERMVGFGWKAARGPMYEGPVEISITVFLKVPKSYAKKTKEAMLRGDILPTRTPDISNVLKSAEDGLNKIAYNDDSQITKVYGYRYYSNEPGLLISVTPTDITASKQHLSAALSLRDAVKEATRGRTKMQV